MTTHDFYICPSILSADFARLGEEVDAVAAAGADRLHIDVMDYHYVPNLTFGPLVCTALRHRGIKIPMDVHLMVTPVDGLIQDFAKAGARCIIFHPDASTHVDRSIKLIKSLGCEAGLALNPATPITVLDYTLDQLDRVLIMSVNPGFGGQDFIQSSLVKAKNLRQKINALNLPIRLEIDGGVKVNNIAEIAAAGVDTFVAGSSIFGSKDYYATLQAMRGELAKV
jgi:ribulose-phosphate 3-epimerase